MRSRWFTSILAGAVVTVLVGLLYVPAISAELAVQTQPLRTWPVPGGTSPYTAKIDGTLPGTTIMMGNRGTSPEAYDPRCLIVVADSERAVAYTYRHEFSPTVCVDAVAHGEGGFFLRGAVVEDPEDIGLGFTARIGADGVILWTVDDDALIEGLAHPDGPGEFKGEYAGALAGLVFDATSDLLVAMTLGYELLPEREYPVDQVHTIDAETGELRVSGLTFGPRLRDPIVDIISRDGEFFVHTIYGSDEEPQFYSYDGHRQVSRFEPGDENWNRRLVVAPIEYADSAGTFILWTDDGGQPTSGLVRLEGLDDVVWSEEYDSVAPVGREMTFIGTAERAWVGADVVAIRYRTPEHERFIRFVDIEDGAELVVVPWDELVAVDPLHMVRGVGSELLLLAVDPIFADVWLYRLDFTDDQDLSEDGSGADEESENGGCSTSGGLPSPASILLLLVALAALSRCEKAGSALQ